MTDALTPIDRYDSKTIALHWLTAGLVIGLWCLGQTIDWFPRGTGRTLARSTHITAGALLTCVLLYRVWWRLTAGQRLAGLGSRAMQLTAKSMHIALYLAIATAVVLGVANAWIRGDNLFGLYKIPSFDPTNKALRTSIEDWHALAANVLLILAGLHAAAGIAHHRLKGNVITRMMPAPRP